MFDVLTLGWARLTDPFIPLVVRSMSTKLVWELCTETSADTSQDPRLRILSWAQYALAFLGCRATELSYFI
ncbi:hypothetical protein TNCV_4591181 [Trichonephila clavipes]|nr:hypothetical protein TNCV_4591181 [Trichonephila clavipes]